MSIVIEQNIILHCTYSWNDNYYKQIINSQFFFIIQKRFRVHHVY